MAKENWSATEFLNSLATKSTRDNYQTSLKQFFEFIYNEGLGKRDYLVRLDELSRKYFHDGRDYEKDYTLFHSKLKEKSAPKTLEVRCLAVRGFFVFNGADISKGVLIRVNGRKAVEPISEERVPRKEELKIILSNLPLHVKAYGLVMLSSGLRPGEALGLKDDDLEEDGDLTRVNLKGRGTKTGRRRWTYISPEARRILDLWLKGRDEFRRKVSESIINQTRADTYLKNTKDRIFPFSYNAVNKVWAGALRKTGFLKRASETGRVTLRLHNLRKFFSTRGKWSDHDMADFFQGHLGGVRAVYARYDEAEEMVRSAYVEAIPSLTIFEEGIDRPILEDLTEKLSNKDAEIASIRAEMLEMKRTFLEMFAQKSPDARGVAELVSLGMTPKRAKAELRRQDAEVAEALKKEGK